LWRVGGGRQRGHLQRFVQVLHHVRDASLDFASRRGRIASARVRGICSWGELSGHRALLSIQGVVGCISSESEQIAQRQRGDSGSRSHAIEGAPKYFWRTCRPERLIKSARDTGWWRRTRFSMMRLLMSRTVSLVATRKLLRSILRTTRSVRRLAVF